jgi:CRP-like cAMP-binding protein
MHSDRGHVVMSIEASPGSLLGLPGLLGDEPYTLTAVAHPGSRLCFISREDFIALMHSDMRLALRVLQVLAAEVRSARNALRDR